MSKAKSRARRSAGKPAARPKFRKAAPLWRFTDAGDGSFVVPDPDHVTGLYFPLCNLAGMKCSVTPQLKGDVCSDFQHYLSVPVVTEDLHRVVGGRNFWVRVAGEAPWSVAGVSAFAKAQRWDGGEDARVEAGLGYFRTVRANRRLGLEAEATVFVPAGNDTVEIVHVTVTNVGRKNVRFTPTAATPIFGRMADNLRDHRQVTTMFNTVEATANGVIVKPSIVHDETGHRENDTLYAVMGFSGSGAAPKQVWSDLRDFVGPGGSLDNPEAVYRNLPAPKLTTAQRSGRETVGAMRFAPVTLRPGQSASYVVLHCITDDRRDLTRWKARYGAAAKAAAALKKTRRFWKGVGDGVRFDLPDGDFNNWMKWASAQLYYRKVFGNSYLPDFGYGRGGRGWRDLWSDLLSLFLLDPAGSRDEMVNNFRGVRIDGSNATIVGTRPGEFKADRNDIVRAWCDHGAWPFFVLKFYIDQTGDFGILRRDLPYWKDHLAMRCRERDGEWSREQGNRQRTKAGGVYKGSILEHLLLEVVSTFFHVGEHNNILLEGGDWNDTYDNARKRGESVCFSNFYAGDLKELAETLEQMAKRGTESVELLQETLVLFDRLPGGKRVRYASPAAKQKRLAEYMESVRHAVSGRRREVRTLDLAKDLRAKADWLFKHIRGNEWIRTKDGQRFFNGHYDDHARRVHGDHPNGVRMDLTSQVLPTIFGVAADEQVPQMHEAVLTYLKDPVTGGLRLCTDFGELKLDFGRVTGFVYGYKEHGSVWNQQNMMYMYGMYRRGFVREAHDVLAAVRDACLDSATCRTFPCIPSFIDKNGQGGYCYLTGSATWLLLGAITQMFGVRGEWGDLCIEPKLLRKQFDAKGRAAAALNFLGKRIEVAYRNDKRREWDEYAIASVRVNGEEPNGMGVEGARALIPRKELLHLCTKRTNRIVVTLE